MATPLPMLTSLTLPGTVDVTGGTASATFSIGYTDTGGPGIFDGVIALDHSVWTPSGLTSQIAVTVQPNGMLTLNEPILATTDSHTYDVVAVDLFDQQLTSNYYSTSQIQTLGLPTSFVVKSNLAPDNTPPVLTSLSLPSTIDISKGSTSATFSASATDVGTGVYEVALSVSPSLPSTYGLSSFIYLSDASQYAANGTDTTSLMFPGSTAVGTYDVNSALLEDNAGNFCIYSASQLQTMGLSTSFTVSSGPVTPTAVVNAPSQVNEGQSGFDLSLTFKNASSAISNITVSYDSASTALNGVDVNVPFSTHSTSFVQAPAGDYTVDLGQIGLPTHYFYGTKVIDITVTASGQTFDNGQNTETLAVVLNGERTTNGPAALSDFNADGHTDLLWRQAGGTFSTWDVTSEVSGAQEARNVDLDSSVGNAWQVQGTFDFNGDGAADILFRNTATGAFTVWDAHGSGFTPNVYGDASVGTTWSVAGLGDLNGDGRDDILWRNASGALTEWQSTGSSFAANVYQAQVDPSWHVVGLGDFNGDGKADILWRNTSGALTEWQSTGSSFAQNVYGTSAVGTDWHVEGVGDFNGDGRADILWRNDNGAFTIWDSTGSSFTQNVYADASVNNTWHIVEVGDFNGDGKADILWRNDSGTFTVWQSTGTGFNANVLTDASVGTDWTIQTHHYDFV